MRGINADEKPAYEQTDEAVGAVSLVALPDGCGCTGSDTSPIGMIVTDVRNLR